MNKNLSFKKSPIQSGYGAAMLKSAVEYVWNDFLMHSYEIKDQQTMDWSVSTLNEYNFVQKTISHPDLIEYRKNLQIADDSKVNESLWQSGITQLIPVLSDLLQKGIDVEKLDENPAKGIATFFVQDEFLEEAQDEDYLFSTFGNASSQWHLGVGYDWSAMIVNKRSMKLTIIDLTGAR